MNQVISEVQVNGETYVLKSSLLDSTRNINSDIRIVVLQRGWVYVGRFVRNENLCQLHDASCIRLWGTTKGLQELVHGPTSSTKLDRCDGVVEFDWLTVIHTISVEGSKWQL